MNRIACRRRAAVAARSHRGLLPRLLLYVALDHGAGDHTGCSAKVAPRPQARHLAQVGELLAQMTRGVALEPEHNLIRSKRWGSGNQDMHVVRLDGHVENLALKTLRCLPQEYFPT